MNTNLYFIYKPTNQWIDCVDGKWTLVENFDKIIYHDAIYEMINEIVDDINCNIEDIDIINKNGEWLINPEEAAEILNTIDQEGFHYCFNKYSKWTKIKDPHFHKLRNNYIEITKELTEYIESKIIEL